MKRKKSLSICFDLHCAFQVPPNIVVDFGDYADILVPIYPMDMICKPFYDDYSLIPFMSTPTNSLTIPFLYIGYA
jgi:hypothetical protein